MKYFENITAEDGLKTTWLVWGLAATLVLILVIAYVVTSKYRSDGSPKWLNWLCGVLAVIYLLLSMTWWYAMYVNNKNSDVGLRNPWRTQ